MNVLIGCEESGTVRDAFLKRGHKAWSNDLVSARNGGPHLKMDVFDAIEKAQWDIIILHPDCTKLSLSGNRWWAGTKEREEALYWTEKLWECAKKHARIGCAIENPTSVLWTRIGKPQYIQPHNFGHKEVKRTGILTHNLPELVHTNEVGPPPPAGTEERKKWEKVWRMAKSETRKRDRSKTYDGIAEAFADQWGNVENLMKEMMK